MRDGNYIVFFQTFESGVEIGDKACCGVDKLPTEKLQ